jgi:hypothetical protein
VRVPDFARVVASKDFQPTRKGVPVQAKYFEVRDLTEDDLIYWNDASRPDRSVFSTELGAVMINLSPDVLENDERFLHILAHEAFELIELKKIFDESGGGVLASRFHDLTEPLATVKNLHWYAWEHADSVLERYREATK